MSDLKDESYYENLDKRTREYKDYIKLKKAQEKVLKEEDNRINGLGDVIGKITEVTGIKKAVKLVTEDCGCDKRHDKANELLSFRTRAVNCISDLEDYRFLKSFFSKRRTRITAVNQVKLINIYNEVFAKNESIPNCPTCSAKGFLKNIRKLENYYRAVEEVSNEEE